jgi:peptide subunit release factor 1 (eRF1)
MITEQVLKELVKLSDKDAQIVSLYLNVDPSRHSKDEYRLTWRNLVKGVSDVISEEDVRCIEQYLDFEYDWQGKSLAIFCSVKKGIWRAYPLPVPVKDQIYVLPRAYIEPLARMLDLSGHYVAAIVAREGVRLFRFRAGRLEDTAGTFGPLPERHKQGGWAASRLQRHADEMAQRNLRDGADLLIKFCEQSKCNQIVLAGTDENVHLFTDLLPKAWQERVVGSFALDITASESEVLERSLAVMQQADVERERRLAEQVITAAAKGGAGTIGLADTMAAVADGRAMTLLISDGFEAEGYRCVQCHFTTVERMETCAFCGGAMEHVADAVNSLIHLALERGVEVEVVHENEAMSKAGSIGALLRY